MSTRFAALLAGASLVAGCDSNKNFTGPKPETAVVRFINVTNGGIDVAVGGLVSTANTNIASLASTQCFVVNAATPALTFRSTGTTTDLSGFTASFTPGHRYWVAAIVGANGTQFVTLDQAFTPAAAATDNGIAGLNAITGTTNYDLHVTLPAATLGSTTVKDANLAFGVPSAIANNTIPFNTATPPVAQPQQLQFTTAGTTTVERNAGNSTFVPNTSVLAIIAPGTATTPTTLRSVVNTGC